MTKILQNYGKKIFRFLNYQSLIYKSTFLELKFFFHCLFGEYMKSVILHQSSSTSKDLGI